MSLACPRDGVELRPEHIHDVPVAECPGCHGAWFDLLALEELEKTATQDAEALAGTIEFLETEDTLQCPSCGKPMQRFDHRAHDLQLDACDGEHGFWVDAGKAERVREIMRGRKADCPAGRLGRPEVAARAGGRVQAHRHRPHAQALPRPVKSALRAPPLFYFIDVRCWRPAEPGPARCHHVRSRRPRAQPATGNSAQERFRPCSVASGAGQCTRASSS